ncbi:proteasome lid subunit RPN8/RPN11 [Symbiobacterium terraclitae]|uniref:Proteasome lid subunit RPN8/RPN11 n=1 Tax=Symbiobacterium terraclitae TaxID=557451 RepID=A0ABS4JRX5_9FIRM|nr:M67 family metallopeptidase [Symbiobacterium terraclitae]MBP2017209.1 proteasome lid subunit RPN8/RPN11 [Symbiobacterium terraclitae]
MAARRLVIGRRLLQRMLEHCLEEKPLEACGILAGTNGYVNAVYATDNARRSPVSYQVDPEQQEEALRRIAAAGEGLLGIYHSHPSAKAVPSRSDIEYAVHYPDAVRLIISLDGPIDVGAFLIRDGQVEPVHLHIRDGLGGTYYDLRQRCGT